MTELKHLSLRAQFADWYYLRTGELITTPKGELAFNLFLEGKLILICPRPKK